MSCAFVVQPMDLHASPRNTERLGAVRHLCELPARDSDSFGCKATNLGELARLGFAVARAVVTETGGPTSHAAMVAREYGVPCVRGVSGLMGLVRDGDELVVDGSRGLVNRVWREEPAWSGHLMDLTASGPSPPPRSPSRRTAGRSHSRAGTEACSAPSGSAAGAGSRSGSNPSCS
jgi:hypothetical protein